MAAALSLGGPRAAGPGQKQSMETTLGNSTWSNGGPAALRPARWDDVRLRFLARFGPGVEARGGTWAEYEPRYRFGWEMTNDRRYQGRAFAEVEGELAREWERSQPGVPWGQVKEIVHEAWQAAAGG